MQRSRIVLFQLVQLDLRRRENANYPKNWWSWADISGYQMAWGMMQIEASALTRVCIEDLQGVGIAFIDNRQRVDSTANEDQLVAWCGKQCQLFYMWLKTAPKSAIKYLFD